MSDDSYVRSDSPKNRSFLEDEIETKNPNRPKRLKFFELKQQEEISKLSLPKISSDQYKMMRPYYVMIAKKTAKSKDEEELKKNRKHDMLNVQEVYKELKDIFHKVDINKNNLLY